MLNSQTQRIEKPGVIPDWTALQERLGSPEDCAPLCAALLSSGGEVRTRAGFDSFLASYSKEMLLPLDLPVIEQAFDHASAGRARELIALDTSLSARITGGPLSAASARMGRIQLRRLKAMKAHRCITRYAAAVDSGEAFGWHSVVYGVVMATFSLPLRDGLHHYARQTVRGFILAASETLQLTLPECREIESTTLAPIPDAIEALVKNRYCGEFKVV